MLDLFIHLRQLIQSLLLNFSSEKKREVLVNLQKTRLLQIGFSDELSVVFLIRSVAVLRNLLVISPLLWSDVLIHEQIRFFFQVL